MTEPRAQRGTKSDIANLSLAELRELHAEIGAQIAEKEKAEKAALAADFERLAKERGFAVADILPLFPGLPAAERKGKGGSKRGTVAPKYRNAADGATWSGRGRQPAWVQAHIAGGGKLEDLAIAPGAAAAE